MSNTCQIKRYDPTIDGDCRFQTRGEFVKYDDHLNIVNDLEIRIDDLKRGLDKIFKVVSSFNGGLTPVGCDGVIMLKVDEYNALVSAINTAE